ncbi:tyrosinase-like [Branchiostoma floridae]|uniref:Tyrosinase n=1 Tax=Branchiostoma floridae TaxID=7739 RepID=A0A9J7MSC3_BRAFL|nr:tyrosinase-like [Branchiostoma floridae]
MSHTLKIARQKRIFVLIVCDRVWQKSVLCETMATVKRLVLVAVLWMALLQVTDAQFPRACTDAASFRRRECCPVPTGFTEPCGGTGRGQCANFTDPTPTNQTEWPPVYNLDDRRRWPSVFFTRFCSCEGNFAGADCGMCKRGFRGSNCTETKILIRKNVLNLTAEEKAKFIAYINNTKYAQIQYVAASESYANASIVPQFRNVSAYDFFVYLQYYAGVHSFPSGLDFSQGSAGFATWNRAFLVAFELAVQVVNADYDFALPYYDWTESSSCNSSNVCSNDLVGANNASGMLDDMSVFSRWNTVCAPSNTTGAKPCDVNVDTGPIIRKADGSLPAKKEVNFAQRLTTFDKAGYNKTSDCSFRNLLEGFVNTGTGIHDPGRRYLNEQVHQSLGGTGGTMSQLWQASNDPIFYLHRCFMDRIFEKWMRRHNVSVDAALPESGAAPGHNRHENIVPLFPPISHAAVYKRSTALGYDYADISSNGMSGSNIGPDDCPVLPTTTPMMTTTPVTAAGPEPAHITAGLIVGFCVAAALGIAALGMLAYCIKSYTSKPAP